MKLLLDTNILLRIADENSAEHLLVTRAVTICIKQGFIACITPQNLIELWSVATRPKNVNGLGWNYEIVEHEILDFLEEYTLLEENPNVFPNWQKLVVQYQVLGKQVHDTKLVAAMLTHNIETILTLNPNDFLRFSEIKTLHPTGVLEETNP